MRSATQVAIAVLILGLWAGVVSAGGGSGGSGGHWGGFGKKSSGSSTGGFKSGTIQPDSGKSGPALPDAAGKGEMPSVDAAGKGSDAIQRIDTPVAPVGGQPGRTSGDLERVLTDLQSLRERQVITDEEYRRYRRQILDEFVRPSSPR